MDTIGENLARSVFTEFLKRHGVRSVAWRKRGDPPDFGLVADGISLAVEVTRVMEATTHGGVTLRAHGWRASLERFLRRIEAEAIARSILNGSYAMVLSPIEDFKRREGEILSSALEYIAETQKVAAAPSRQLFRLPRGRAISITKVGMTPVHLGALILISQPKWGIEARGELVGLFGERVGEKRHRLRRLRRPKALLLIDSYVYAESEDWQAVADLTDLSDFHTVARIADRECQVLHSRSAKWRGTT